MTDHQRADTVRRDHPAKTPNARRLADAGVEFANTYCTAPHCCPSRASFFSGLYPSRSGVWNNILNDQRLSWGLNPGVRLFSEDLADAGYRMFYTGKWHVDGCQSPERFAWRSGTLSARPGDSHGLTWLAACEKAGQWTAPLAHRDDGIIERYGYPNVKAYGTRTGKVADDQTTLEAVEKIRQFADGDSPWCVFAGLTGPHDPYMVPQRFLDLYDLDDVPLPLSFSDDLRDKPRIYQRLRRDVWGQLSDREVRDAIRHFWAYCSYLDELLGQMLDAVDQSGQAENTLVLFCADHGDYCGDHGLFSKGIPAFTGAYQVPAIIRYLGRLKKPGRVVNELVSLTDLYPTFLEAAGLPARRGLAGSSLMPFIEDRTPSNWRDALFGQCNGVELLYTQRWIHTPDHRYVFNGFDFDELYDLRADPHQMRNCADDPAFADIKRSLCARMWSLARELGDAAPCSYVTVGFAPAGPGAAFIEA